MLTAIQIPDFLRMSPLLRDYRGYAIYEGLPDARTYNAMVQEAHEVYATASYQQSDDDDHEEVRGGVPRRRLFSACAGPAQDAFYLDRHLHQFLSELCGGRVVPSGTRGSYSYYVNPGDYLDLHRDIVTCDVTLISCMQDSSPPDDPQGALVMYPDRVEEPLSSIRATLDEGAVAVKLAPGQSIVLLGGVVPHRVLPVADGQARVISALCFEATATCS